MPVVNKRDSRNKPRPDGTSASSTPVMNFHPSVEAFPDFELLTDYYPSALFVANEDARWSCELEFCVEDFLGKRCATSPVVSFGGTLQCQATIKTRGIEGPSGSDKHSSKTTKTSRKKRSSASTQIAIVLNVTPPPVSLSECPLCHRSIDPKLPMGGASPKSENGSQTPTKEQPPITKHAMDNELCICKTDGVSSLMPFSTWVVPSVYYEVSLINFYDTNASLVKWGMTSFSHLNPTKVIRDFAPRSLIQRGYLARKDIALLKIRLCARFDDPRFRVSPAWFHEVVSEDFDTKRRKPKKEKSRNSSVSKTEETRGKVVRWLNGSKEFRALEGKDENPFAKDTEKSSSTQRNSSDDDDSSDDHSLDSDLLFCISRHHHLHFHSTPSPLRSKQQIGQIMGASLQPALNPHCPRGPRINSQRGDRRLSQIEPTRLRPPGASHDWRSFEPLFHPILRMDFLRVMAECLPFDYADVFQAIVYTQKKTKKAKAALVSNDPVGKSAGNEDNSPPMTTESRRAESTVNCSTPDGPHLENKMTSSEDDKYEKQIFSGSLFPLNLPPFIDIMCYTGDDSSSEDEFDDESSRSRKKSGGSSDVEEIPESCTLVEVKTADVLLAVLMKRLIGNCRESPTAHISRYNLYIMIRLITATAGYDSISDITNVQSLVAHSIPAIVQAFHHCYEIAGRKMVETQRRSTFHYKRYLTQLKIQRQLRLQHLSSPYLTVGSDTCPEQVTSTSQKLMISLMFGSKPLGPGIPKLKWRKRVRESERSVTGHFESGRSKFNRAISLPTKTPRDRIVRFIPLHPWRSWLLRNAKPERESVKESLRELEKRERKEKKERAEKKERQKELEKENPGAVEEAKDHQKLIEESEDILEKKNCNKQSDLGDKKDDMPDQWHQPRQRKDRRCSTTIRAFQAVLRYVIARMAKVESKELSLTEVCGLSQRRATRIYCRISPISINPEHQLLALDLQQVAMLDVPHLSRENRLMSRIELERERLNPKVYFMKSVDSARLKNRNRSTSVQAIQSRRKSIGAFRQVKSYVDQRLRPSAFVLGYRRAKKLRLALEQANKNRTPVDVSDYIIVSDINPSSDIVFSSPLFKTTKSVPSEMNETEGETEEKMEASKSSTFDVQDDDVDLHPAFFSRYTSKKQLQFNQLNQQNDGSVFAGLACHELLGMQRVRCVFEIAEITRYRLLVEVQKDDMNGSKPSMFGRGSDSDSPLDSAAKRMARRRRFDPRYKDDDSMDDSDDEDNSLMSWDENSEVFEERKSCMQLSLSVGSHAKSLEGLIYDHLAEQTCLG